MFEQLFRYPGVIEHYRAAPLARDRLRYLVHLAGSGARLTTLRAVASRQLALVRLLDVREDRPIRGEQLEVAAERWAQPRPRRSGRTARPAAVAAFLAEAVRWLRFAGRLESGERSPRPAAVQISDFADWMRRERGLAESTIRSRCHVASDFLDRFHAWNLPLETLTIADLDRAVAAKSEQGGCGRHTLHAYLKSLRAFFRYAEARGWCAPYTARVIATRYGVTDGPPSEAATGTPMAGAGGGGGGGRGTPTPTPQPQTQQSQTPLTASFVSVPAAHDGETAFWLELSFDTPVVQGSKPQIQELLSITGGSETRLRRKNGRLDHWQIQVNPSSHDAVTVTLSPSPPCGETGAVCTEDGRTFTTGLATQIQGPASGDSHWSDESVGTPVTPVPALPLAGIGILGLLLALLGSRRELNDRRHLDASRGS